VVPIQFQNHAECLAAAAQLMANGYYVPPIPMLAVSKDKPRIRFFISAAHTYSDITGALDTIEKACRSSKELSHGEAASDGHPAG
jgi:8-amino-7-oxononanoate synthase